MADVDYFEFILGEYLLVIFLNLNITYEFVRDSRYL